VKQHLQRQSGVANVDVSLIDGKVQIVPKEDGKIDPAQLLKATYDGGVSVAELDMVARGTIVKDSSGGLALQVEPNQSIVLAAGDMAKELEPLAGTATEITIRGQLYKKTNGKKKADTSSPLKFVILEIQKKE
jgi:hypothetical protein